MKWQTVTQEPSALGESPFWHPRERLLYWVDIPGRKILRANPVTGAVQSWEMPLEPGCIAPAASGGLVVALRDGIYRAQEWGVGLRLLHRIDHDVVTTRFNDGKADPLGRFWAGTMYEPRTSAVAELLSLDCRDGRTPQVQRMAGGATIANGLAWSPDQRQVYWADTLQHTIWVWDWNAADNTMSGEREFHRFAPKPEGWHSGMDGYGGRPDGAAVDCEGNYYVAMFEGQQILKLAPDGRILAALETPVVCPTMPCFGGDDLKTLYVTSARYNRPTQELAQMPESGCVFSTRVGVAGLPVNLFRD
ncbi:MAG: SMP-30/gluconolactonase/LRE family protein [Rhodoferax sp.]|jgi:sugar lactone lactonase YvrE|nr:SMP-30/gluconolactonase/LRE family protein [Rhodoferax sp.]MBP9929472.1 SMP-30/gluconolactonase/LRE family protein [Rhodoferax sp.]HQX57559.1 SMP-30/gluconolactonase/LRE family protein [Burkholderiaceae bacterium]HQZ04778.1 SMP-30/gluconolactonase/LRE family protein [Burkholderiaceae bacterium]HRA62565.1 SMP-30/gluconolactonase/LRE family protein [Burkholderiaceae bacterium]